MTKKLDLDDLQSILCCIGHFDDIAEKIDPKREKHLDIDTINQELGMIFLRETGKLPWGLKHKHGYFCISKDKLKEFIEET